MGCRLILKSVWSTGKETDGPSKKFSGVLVGIETLTSVKVYRTRDVRVL